MRKLYSLFLISFILLFVAAKPPTGGGTNTWKQFDSNLSKWTPINAPGLNGDISTAKISTVFANYTAFITTNLTGNILGKTITATFTVEVISGNPDYIYGLWQLYPGGIPSARLYFSRHADYTMKGFNSDRSGYWFCWNNWVEIDDILGTVTLTTTVSPENWSESYGGYGNDPLFTSAFIATAQNIKMVGLAIGDTINFYDTGVATVDGSAIIHLHSFTIQ